MRIKKKHVLLESNLIDMTSEFTPQEKRLLFVLNKKYGPHDYTTFNIWDAATFLIELFDIPYDLAYELSETYYYNGDKLFKEYEPIRRKQNSAEIFFRHLSDIFEIVKNERTNTDEGMGMINIKFKGDDYGGNVVSSDIKLWNHSYGFTLYIPFTWQGIGEWPNTYRVGGEEKDDRLLMVSVLFKEIKSIKPPIDKWHENLNEDKVNVVVTVEIGDRDNRKKNIKNFMKFKIPIPKPVSKQGMIDVVNITLNDVIEKIKNTEFDLPKNGTPIVVSSESDTND